MSLSDYINYPVTICFKLFLKQELKNDVLNYIFRKKK